MKRRVVLICEDDDDYAAIRVAARSVHGKKDPSDDELGIAIATICRAHIAASYARTPKHEPAELPGQAKLFDEA